MIVDGCVSLVVVEVLMLVEVLLLLLFFWLDVPGRPWLDEFFCSFC